MRVTRRGNFSKKKGKWMYDSAIDNLHRLGEEDDEWICHINHINSQISQLEREKDG